VELLAWPAGAAIQQSIFLQGVKGPPPGRAAALARQRRLPGAFSGKACPGLDPGWRPVFRPQCDNRKKLEHIQFPLKLNVL